MYSFAFIILFSFTFLCVPILCWNETDAKAVSCAIERAIVLPTNQTEQDWSIVGVDRPGSCKRLIDPVVNGGWLFSCDFKEFPFKITLRDGSIHRLEKCALDLGPTICRTNVTETEICVHSEPMSEISIEIPETKYRHLRFARDFCAHLPDIPYLVKCGDGPIVYHKESTHECELGWGDTIFLPPSIMCPHRSFLRHYWVQYMAIIVTILVVSVLILSLLIRKLLAPVLKFAFFIIVMIIFLLFEFISFPFWDLLLRRCVTVRSYHAIFKAAMTLWSYLFSKTVNINLSMTSQDKSPRNRLSISNAVLYRLLSEVKNGDRNITENAKQTDEITPLDLHIDSRLDGMPLTKDAHHSSELNASEIGIYCNVLFAMSILYILDLAFRIIITWANCESWRDSTDQWLMHIQYQPYPYFSQSAKFRIRQQGINFFEDFANFENFRNHCIGLSVVFYVLDVLFRLLVYFVYSAKQRMCPLPMLCDKCNKITLYYHISDDKILCTVCHGKCKEKQACRIETPDFWPEEPPTIPQWIEKEEKDHVQMLNPELLTASVVLIIAFAEVIVRWSIFAYQTSKRVRKRRYRMQCEKASTEKIFILSTMCFAFISSTPIIQVHVPDNSFKAPLEAHMQFTIEGGNEDFDLRFDIDMGFAYENFHSGRIVYAYCERYARPFVCFPWNCVGPKLAGYLGWTDRCNVFDPQSGNWAGVINNHMRPRRNWCDWILVSELDDTDIYMGGFTTTHLLGYQHDYRNERGVAIRNARGRNEVPKYVTTYSKGCLVKWLDENGNEHRANAPIFVHAHMNTEIIYNLQVTEKMTEKRNHSHTTVYSISRGCNILQGCRINVGGFSITIPAVDRTFPFITYSRPVSDYREDWDYTDSTLKYFFLPHLPDGAYHRVHTNSAGTPSSVPASPTRVTHKHFDGETDTITYAYSQIFPDSITQQKDPEFYLERGDQSRTPNCNLDEFSGPEPSGNSDYGQVANCIGYYTSGGWSLMKKQQDVYDELYWASNQAKFELLTRRHGFTGLAGEFGLLELRFSGTSSFEFREDHEATFECEEESVIYHRTKFLNIEIAYNCNVTDAGYIEINSARTVVPRLILATQGMLNLSVKSHGTYKGDLVSYTIGKYRKEVIFQEKLWTGTLEDHVTVLKSNFSASAQALHDKLLAEKKKNSENRAFDLKLSLGMGVGIGSTVIIIIIVLVVACLCCGCARPSALRRFSGKSVFKKVLENDTDSDVAEEKKMTKNMRRRLRKKEEKKKEKELSEGEKFERDRRANMRKQRRGRAQQRPKPLPPISGRIEPLRPDVESLARERTRLIREWERLQDKAMMENYRQEIEARMPPIPDMEFTRGRKKNNRRKSNNPNSDVKDSLEVSPLPQRRSRSVSRRQVTNDENMRSNRKSKQRSQSTSRNVQFKENGKSNVVEKRKEASIANEEKKVRRSRNRKRKPIGEVRRERRLSRSSSFADKHPLERAVARGTFPTDKRANHVLDEMLDELAEEIATWKKDATLVAEAHARYCLRDEKCTPEYIRAMIVTKMMGDSPCALLAVICASGVFSSENGEDIIVPQRIRDQVLHVMHKIYLGLNKVSTKLVHVISSKKDFVLREHDVMISEKPTGKSRHMFECQMKGGQKKYIEFDPTHEIRGLKTLLLREPIAIGSEWSESSIARTRAETKKESNGVKVIQGPNLDPLQQLEKLSRGKDALIPYPETHQLISKGRKFKNFPSFGKIGTFPKTLGAYKVTEETKPYKQELALEKVVTTNLNLFAPYFKLVPIDEKNRIIISNDEFDVLTLNDGTDLLVHRDERTVVSVLPSTQLKKKEEI